LTSETVDDSFTLTVNLLVPSISVIWALSRILTDILVLAELVI
jgi:hypothetical protein